MLEQKINNLFKSEFLRNTLTLISGVGIAQIIPILLQTYLRRIFSPEDFGVFAVYMSMLGIMAIISSLRYQMAIVIPKKDEEAVNLFFLVLFINISFLILLYTLILFFKDEILNLVNFPVKYAYWLYFLPLSIFLFSVYDAMNYWLIRKKAFKASAINKISRRSFEGITQSATGIMKNPIGLVLGDIIGNIANNISGIIQIKKNGFSGNLFNTRILLKVLKKHLDFPKNAIPAMLNMAGILLPVIFINKFYTESITGYIDLTRMVLSVPGILISTAISKVLLQNISQKINSKKSILKDLLKVFYVLLLISFIEIIIIVGFAPSIFTFVFGSNGTTSGLYAQTLVFAFAFRFIVSPLSFVLIAIRKIKIVSIWQICYFIAILLLILFKDLAFSQFIKFYVTIDIVMYLLYFVVIISYVRKYEKNL